jgi:hypothetical protein
MVGSDRAATVVKIVVARAVVVGRGEGEHLAAGSSIGYFGNYDIPRIRKDTVQ